MPDQEALSPNDTLNKLSQALIQISRGDPFVALRNEFQTQLKAIETRFVALDKATVLQHEDMVRVPTMLDKAITSIRDLLEQRMMTSAAEIAGRLHAYQSETSERFSAIALQFTERDVRVEQASVASKTAIDAAFLANQKAADANAESNDKAITKSEGATKEKIDGLQALLTGSINDIRGQIATLTSRQDRAEGASKGVTDSSFERRGSIGMVVGVAAVSATGISMLVGAVLFIATHVAAPAPAPAPAPLSYAAPTVVSPAVVPVQPK